MSNESRAMTKSREGPASTFNGYLLLLLALAALAGTAWAFMNFAQAMNAGQPAGQWLAAWIGGVLVVLFVLAGFYMIQPNQAVVITLFGEYRGTDRNQG